MTGVVVDASVALAWCFPDEGSDYADRVLVAVEGHVVLVPALWSIEITNALLVAEKRKRIKQVETRRFIDLLSELTVVMDARSVADAVSDILPLGREYVISAYDAAYLDVAIRHGVPLATLDSNLRKAGSSAGIEIFG